MEISGKDVREFMQAFKLSARRTLLFKITQQHHANITAIMISNMRTLVTQRPPLPDPAGGINNQMIGNIAISPVAMTGQDI
jgi:hypothetical protein